MTTTSLPRPPHRLPLLGDVLTVTRHDPVQAEAKMFRELGSPIYERRVGPSTLIMVGGAAAAHDVCNEDAWSHATLGPAQYFRRYVPSGLFTSSNSDPLWHSARDVLNPAFTREAMVGYHADMRDAADTIINRWCAQEQIVDVTEETTKLTVEVIGKVGFGTDLGLLDDAPLARSETYRALETVLQWGSDSANAIPLLDLPRQILGTRKADRAARHLHQFANDLITTRRADQTPGNSMLDRMLTVPDSSGELLPDRNIAENVITFLVAGHETTASLLSAALFYLARDPQLQDALRTEVAAATEDGWSYDSVNKMRGIASVIQEVLRLHPPAPALFRIAQQDTTVAGYPIKRGSIALLVLIAAHTDPAIWGSTADQFDGLRFKSKQPTDAFLRPWGVGPRSCIGRQFAQHEAAVTLARLLDRATLSTPQNGTQPVMLERGLMRPGAHSITVEENTR